MAKLMIENFTKKFGEVKAVDNVNITVEDGEFLTLLGPSGCGKSTTLFAIAGLDNPTSGKVTLGDTVFFDGGIKKFMEPEKRNCGLVFQSYALWPHMTVRKNLAFPLELRKVSKAEKDRRIFDALSLVEMEGLIDRYPHELSGGQQQRVALARTLVYEPSLLLLDEPLSNLDAKLRIKARSWLKHLTRRLGLTTVYVTHDQTEALSLSDRIAIMDKGKLVQLDTPENIYRHPANAFVADFIGNSNFIAGTLKEKGPSEMGTVSIGNSTAQGLIKNHPAVGDKITLTVRPENIVPVLGEATEDFDGMNILEGEITAREYLGARFQYFIDLGNGQEVRVETDKLIESTRMSVAFRAEDCLIFEG